MINVEPFKAKLVGDPETRETKRGPVTNMRVRQIDPGKQRQQHCAITGQRGDRGFSVYCKAHAASSWA